MEKKPTSEKIKTKLLNILLPDQLINRVISVCADMDMTIKEFVTDAVIEKLELVHKERRTKQRL